ncbi:hypothetical protein DSO57_1019049 [Entomophthora muscae]|uniref:Uncharacterized protein n=1 Tax=Entomophthora muscae TaxID=34485 RepID=A0ACC2T465_9FUNG|nr:hypothetical protein DSO57_1019049 [Entomophthora muscae]
MKHYREEDLEFRFCQEELDSLHLSQRHKKTRTSGHFDFSGSFTGNMSVSPTSFPDPDALSSPSQNFSSEETNAIVYTSADSVGQEKNGYYINANRILKELHLLSLQRKHA